MTEESKKTKESSKKKVEQVPQEEIEKQVLENYEKKLKEMRELELAKADNLKLMTAVLNDPPYKSENEETKLKYVMLVNEYLKKIQIEKVDSELLSNLSKDNLVKLYDYLNKTFEFLSDLKDVKDGENIFKVNSTFLLKIHQKIMEKYGNTILMKFLSSKKCLSIKVKYGTKQK